MDCKVARMFISAYIDGEINEADVERLNKHLKRCAECMSFYNSMVTLKRILASSHEPKPENEFLTTTLHRLREAKGSQTLSNRPHNCKIIQHKMLELLDGEIEDEDAHGLLEQIARCDTCTAVWFQWERYMEVMKSLRGLPVPAHHKVALIERLREEKLSLQTKIHFAGKLLQWSRQAIVVAMVTAFALLIALLLNHRIKHTVIVQHTGETVKKVYHEGEKRIVTSHIVKESSSRPIPIPHKPSELVKRPQRIVHGKPVSAPAKFTASVVATDETVKPSNINDIRISLKGTGIPMRTNVGRRRAVVREFAERMHATVALPVHHEHEKVASQMLIKKARQEGMSELPELEKITSGTQVTHTLQYGALEATKTRDEEKSIAKSLPKYGIGVASGEALDEELLLQGGLEEALKRWKEAMELTSSKTVSVEGWHMIMGAAFQYRSEVDEVKRLNNYFLGRPDIVERVRPGDTFAGASQNRCLYIKLFRLGVQW